MRVRVTTKVKAGRTNATVDFDAKGIEVKIAIGKADVEKVFAAFVERFGGEER